LPSNISISFSKVKSSDKHHLSLLEQGQQAVRMYDWRRLMIPMALKSTSKSKCNLFYFIEVFESHEYILGLLSEGGQ
jgi:hypothetical protein